MSSSHSVSLLSILYSLFFILYSLLSILYLSSCIAKLRTISLMLKKIPFFLQRYLRQGMKKATDNGNALVICRKVYIEPVYIISDS